MLRLLTILASLHFLNSINAQPTDWRNIETGHSIYENGYIDQPYVVNLQDEAWLCVFTTGSNEEGRGGQHIAASRSTDEGKTWSEPVRIEPATGPPASWAMPYLTDYGRVYVFYIYNGEQVDSLDGKPIRNDMLGWYCFKYSDDGGLTWSEQQRLDIRTTAVDRGNDFEGKTQLMWGIGKPVSTTEGMMFGFTKLGKYMLDQGEGWFMKSSNIEDEKDISKLQWTMLPEGDHGLRHPDYGSVQEEHNIFQLNNEDLYCMYRGRTGFAINSYSRDGGKTWEMPTPATYADGRPLKNSRACPRIWKCTNGDYLFWYHNHSGDNYAGRNPAWLAGGVERNGQIVWSQPEMVLYGEDYSRESGRFSYPDLIEGENKFWITESSKVKAGVHEIPGDFVDGLWGQFRDGHSIVQDSLYMNFGADSLKKEKLQITGFEEHHEGGAVLMNTQDEHGGISLDFKIKLDFLRQGTMLLDARNVVGNGIYLKTAGYHQIELGLCNDEVCETWTTDPGLLGVVKTHHVTFIVDNGPNIITCLVDGQLCDGGRSRQFGWTRFSQYLGKLKTNRDMELSILPEAFKELRIYNKALRTSEAVGNYLGIRD